MTLLSFLNLGMGEILLIALVVLLLFGGRKIPELMQGLGRGVRSFKDGLNTPVSPSDSAKNASASDPKEADTPRD